MQQTSGSVSDSESATKTLEMLQQDNGNEVMTRVRCYKWHSCFKRDRMSSSSDILYECHSKHLAHVVVSLLLAC